jgi:uncharacterized protein
MSTQILSDDELKALLTRVKTIAVVGLSSNPSRASHMVAQYLQEKGYRIIPVTPREDKILGERTYPDLRSITEPVDVVDIFRRPEFIPEIAEQALSIGAKVLWMQQGVRNKEAADRALAGGMTVIEDACMMAEHERLLG